MREAHERFDHWIRHEFADLNQALEEIARAAGEPCASGRQADSLKQALHQQGRGHVTAVLDESPLVANFEDRLELLGNVGMLISACTRHGLNEPEGGHSPLDVESMLALQLGASLGVAPRLILASYATRNPSRNGVHKSFTRYLDEKLFIEYNTQGIFEYERAAEALQRTCDLGISSPISAQFFEEAHDALRRLDVINARLYDEIDVDTFFLSIRPYYRTAFVGNRSYRGVNAGDFAGINEIDLLLGVCQTTDPFYLNVLLEKRDYILPREQDALRSCMVQTSILDRFLGAAREASHREWFKTNARAFLRACEAHAAAAISHHDKLVARFIEKPAQGMDQQQLARLTSSGPPLPALIRTLEKLRDLRAGAARPDIQSRHRDLAELRAMVG